MQIFGVASEDYEMVADERLRTYFPGRSARVMLKGMNCGTCGVIHPEVLKNFK